MELKPPEVVICRFIFWWIYRTNCNKTTCTMHAPCCTDHHIIMPCVWRSGVHFGMRECVGSGGRWLGGIFLLSAMPYNTETNSRVHDCLCSQHQSWDNLGHRHRRLQSSTLDPRDRFSRSEKNVARGILLINPKGHKCSSLFIQLQHTICALSISWDSLKNPYFSVICVSVVISVMGHFRLTVNTASSVSIEHTCPTPKLTL